MKIAIITDSGSNIYHETAEFDLPDVFTCALQVIDDEVGYRDGIDKSISEIYDMIAQGKMLKTSAPLADDIQQKLIEIKQAGYDLVLAIPITTGLSSTANTMRMLANELELELVSVDCYATARIQYQCVLKAQAMINQGKDIAEIVAELQNMINHSITFVVPVDMKHLVKGGRLSPMAAKLAGFLQITPILYLNRETLGKIESFKKVRTIKKALATLVDYFVQQQVNSNYKICIAHVNNPILAQEFSMMIKAKIPDVDLYIVDLVSVVGVHTGLGTIACQTVLK